MKNNVILIFALFVSMLSSCKDEGQRMAKDFVEAINQKDTAKLNNALLPRHTTWSNAIFAEIDEDKLKTERISNAEYKAFVNDTIFFIISKQGDDGYKVTKVKNIFFSSDELLQKAIDAGYLTTEYDDIDALIAVNKKKAELDSQEAESEWNEKVIEKIHSLYDNYVFGGNDFTNDASKYCTSKMLKKLAAAYEYEGGGYAVWELRTGAQDGDGGSQVNDVTALGDGWYEVDFLDMGMHGKKKIKAIKQGSKIMFDDYK